MKLLTIAVSFFLLAGTINAMEEELPCESIRLRRNVSRKEKLNAMEVEEGYVSTHEVTYGEGGGGSGGDARSGSAIVAQEEAEVLLGVCKLIDNLTEKSFDLIKNSILYPIPLERERDFTFARAKVKRIIGVIMHFCRLVGLALEFEHYCMSFSIGELERITEWNKFVSKQDLKEALYDSGALAVTVVMDIPLYQYVAQLIVKSLRTAIQREINRMKRELSEESAFALDYFHGRMLFLLERQQQALTSISFPFSKCLRALLYSSGKRQDKLFSPCLSRHGADKGKDSFSITHFLSHEGAAQLMIDGDILVHPINYSIP